MARAENQKLKALYVAKYILENSDENHYFTAADIIGELEEKYGIIAERRSIYRDLDALSEAFDDFVIEGKQGGKYRLCTRQFEFDDVRLLAECVDAAKFISNEKAGQLIGTLGKLCSTHQADQLAKETLVCNRSKTMQKGTLNYISTIRSAMATRKDGEPHTPQKITFKYLEYDIHNLQSQVERGGGTLYKVSPFKLIINDGNYYLLAFDDKEKKIKTYRIDRMKNVKAIDEPREGEAAFLEKDMEYYTRKVTGMYSGTPQRVTIRFINLLLDTVIDKFGIGPNAFYMPDDKNHFIVSADVEVSNQFYGWLCGFGRRARIVSPESAVKEFKEYLEKINGMYQ